MTAAAPRDARRRLGERGSIGLLVLCGSLLFAGVGLVTVAVAVDVAGATARASTAADAAALAAAASSPLTGGDGEPAAAAYRYAEANGARLERLDDADWPMGVAVEARARPRLAAVRAVVPEVAAEARAELAPR